MSGAETGSALARAKADRLAGPHRGRGAELCGPFAARRPPELPAPQCPSARGWQPLPPLSLPATRQREETFRVVLEWPHRRAARRPVLVVVEDLHWVDASTPKFVGQLLAEGLHPATFTDVRTPLSPLVATSPGIG